MTNGGHHDAGGVGKPAPEKTSPEPEKKEGQVEERREPTRPVPSGRDATARD